MGLITHPVHELQEVGFPQEEGRCVFVQGRVEEVLGSSSQVIGRHIHFRGLMRIPARAGRRARACSLESDPDSLPHTHTIM